MTDWVAIPKVELHLHLEGAAPPGFIRALAAEQGVSLDGVFNEDGSYAWTNFAEFLETYDKACSVLRGPTEFKRLVEAVLAKSVADGVIYTELFIAPDICGGGDAVAWGDYLAAMIEGAQAARRAHGIEARFISTAIRNLGPEAAENAARVTLSAPSPWLTGWGMGGEERHLSAADFARAFAIAGEAGLGLTSHAGEICGADSVRETLDHLKVSRVGHGVRSIEDPELVARLAAGGIVLEVNPGSNIALGVFPDLASHAIAPLGAAGVPITISTDDPPYFHTDMVKEYRELAATFGWGSRDFLAMNHAALDAAFVDAETRASLKSKLDAA